jgi:hypothetical protein
MRAVPSALLGVVALSTLLGCNPGPVYAGDLILETADDVRAFADVEEVEGSVVIEGSSLTDLTGLERLEWIGGALAIGGDLGNASLVSVEGLSGLQRVEGDVTIRRNNLLADLGGLRALSSVGGSIVIQENDALATLNLSSLSTVDSFFTIASNYALTTMTGMEGLEYVDFTLAIDGNSALTNLRGLSNVRSVGRLFIRRNYALPDCAAWGLWEQIDNYGGFTRYDMAVEIVENDEQASCDAGPLG